MIERVPFLIGYVKLKSDLDIEKVGQILSERIFGGLQFEGKEKKIYDEVPAIYIKSNILGFRVILSGYSGLDEDKWFSLEIRSEVRIKGVKREEFKLDNYLYYLLKNKLGDVKDIIIEEVKYKR